MDCNYFLKSLLEQNLDLIKTTKYGVFIFMKSSEIHEISNQISKELRLFSDPVRLIVPHLLSHAKNRRDFYILFELSKFNSTRNQILNIIKKDQNIIEKLNELIKKKSNLTLLKRINFAIKKIDKAEHTN